MERVDDSIDEKIAAFRRRYYSIFLARGVILTLSCISAYFLVISLLEYALWMSRPIRTALAAAAVAGLGACIWFFLGSSLAWWLRRKGLSQEQSAKMIGAFFPAVSDQLLNLIQLSKAERRTPLLEASIAQKARSLQEVRFEQAADVYRPRSRFWLLLIPVGVVVAALWVAPRALTQGALRIVHFNQAFTPPPPFTFHLLNTSMQAFLGEDFSVRLALRGAALPEAAYVHLGGNRFRMQPLSEANTYQYTFRQLERAASFQFEADNLASTVYTIEPIHRATLMDIALTFDFPAYLRRSREQLLSTGSFEAPEGARVTWMIHASNTVAAHIRFQQSGMAGVLAPGDTATFTGQYTVRSSDAYQILLRGAQRGNNDSVRYAFRVIKDQHPQIDVRPLKDTVFYKQILLTGEAADDYGLTALILRYKVGEEKDFLHKKLLQTSFNAPRTQQSFAYLWTLDSLKLQPHEQLAYFLEVWDNDGVSGRKAAHSPVYFFRRPNAKELREHTAKTEKKAKAELSESAAKAKALDEAIEQARRELMGKHAAGWEEQSMLHKILQQKDSLYRSIAQLQTQSDLLRKQSEEFLQRNERTAEQARQLAKLMDELLDDKTKALFEELKKLLEQRSDLRQVKDLLDMMSQSGKDLENALQRMMQLMDRLLFDSSLDQLVQQLQKDIERQEDLLQRTQTDAQQRRQEASDTLAEQQRELRHELGDLRQELEELKEKGAKLGKNNAVPDAQEIAPIEDALQESEKALEKGQSQKAVEPQRQSLRQMRQIQQRLNTLQKQQEGMSKKAATSLRSILYDLIAASYEQEDLMESLANVSYSDPLYTVLGRRQLAVKGNFNILKDSILAIAQQDPFISAATVGKLEDLSSKIDHALKGIQGRTTERARGEMQQSMAGFNDLALLLDDYFESQTPMAAGSGKGGGKNKPTPGLSELQEELNRQISELKKSGKTGPVLSKELARLAAEQEQIRRALRKIEERQRGQKPSDEGKGHQLEDQMEQTEQELINKQITEQTIERQQEILSRLLDAEKSMREQGFDEEREGETAGDQWGTFSKTFEEYKERQKKEAESLKTIPPELNRYYKKEADEYFKRTEEQ